jgi:hypothetical protein
MYGMKSCLTERRRIIRMSNDSCCSITGIGDDKLFFMHMYTVYSLFSCMLCNNEAFR